VVQFVIQFDDPGQQVATADGRIQVGSGTGIGHAAIARQEDVDGAVDKVVAEPADRPSQRVDHVGEATGLGPRLALRGQEGHTKSHGGMVEGVVADARRLVRLNRFT